MKEKQRQLPARLNSEQVGQFFGFQAQEIKALIQVGLLTPKSRKLMTAVTPPPPTDVTTARPTSAPANNPPPAPPLSPPSETSPLPEVLS
jgi:hypothetical protein